MIRTRSWAGPPALPTTLAGALAAALLILAAATTSAQRPPETLARLRNDHEQAVASAGRSLDDVHRLTLRQLERERAEAGDYETAAKVKNRLDTLASQPGTTPITPPPVTHTLTPVRALTRDGANTEGGREYVDFRKPGGKALWDVLGLEKGTYEVFLTYSVGLPRLNTSPLSQTPEEPREAPGGVITFNELSGLNGSSLATLEKKVVTTGAWENYIRESLGRYELKTSPTTVKLEATTATTGGLLRLRQLEFVKAVPGPAAEIETADRPASELADRLATLKTRCQQELDAATAPLHLRFTQAFNALERELATGGQNAAAAATARTRTELISSLQKSVTLPPAASPPAQPDPAAEDVLARLVRDYETRRSTLERPLLATYAQRLTTLRESMETRRDPAATAVANELTRVYSELTQTPATAPAAAPGTPLLAPVELIGGTSQTGGGATTLGDPTGPVHLAGKDSSAEWLLPTLPAGRYRLLWHIACDVGAGATARLVLDGLPPRTLQIQPTSATGGVVIANLGEFVTTSPPSSLKITVLEGPGRQRKIGPSFSISRIIVIPPGVTLPGL